jgi:hypothetical protein
LKWIFAIKLLNNLHHIELFGLIYLLDYEFNAGARVCNACSDNKFKIIMKKFSIVTLFIFSATVLVAQKDIVIKGETNYTANLGTSHIEKRWFNPETLEEEMISIGFTVSDAGKFQIRIPNAENYYHRYWIYVGNHYTHADLIAGDSLYLIFSNNLKYSGLGAGRNNYRTNVYVAFWNDEAMSFTNQVDAVSFLSGLKTFTTNRLNLLNKYTDAGEIDANYHKVEKTLIYNDNAELLLSHISLFEDQINLPEEISSQITNILNGVDLSNDYYLQHSQFRNLIENLPHYKLGLNSKSSIADLKQEISYANKHYTKLMKLYYGKKIIQKYTSRAITLNQKADLLNFFEEQFKEPVLKNVIADLRAKYKIN